MNTLSRRTFLKSTTTASVGFLIIPSFITNTPNNRLNIAVIGVGGRGRANWGQIPKENIVAMCDVDDAMAAEGYKECPKAKRYKDFRVMFDEMANEIDAVIISTPDHTHFAATMAAMELGKHVYVEKPLAHNIWELRTLRKAATYYGIVSQMGNQGHTTDGIRSIKEWYDADVLGDVREVHGWLGTLNLKKGGYYWRKPESFPPPAHRVPDTLDWDLWLGSAADRPFNDAYVPRAWRGFYDFGNGQLGDWSCHTLDAPFWSLDLGMPHTVESDSPAYVDDHSFVPKTSKITYQFGARGKKPPVKLVWHEGSKPDIRPEWGIKELGNSGMIMIGDKKTLLTGGRPNNPKLLVSKEEWREFQKNKPEKIIPRIGEEKPVEEWINAIKNNTLPGSNFNYATQLTEMALIGVMAQRFDARLEYDAKNMKITNRPDLDAYIKEPVRKGWSYGENL